jgi:hypothetical protein
MAEVDRTIGIGQGAGDEDLAWLGHGARLLDETEVGHYKAPAHIFHPVSLFPDAYLVKPVARGLAPVRLRSSRNQADAISLQEPGSRNWGGFATQRGGAAVRQAPSPQGCVHNK